MNKTVNDYLSEKLNNYLSDEDKAHLKYRWRHLDAREKALAWNWLARLFNDIGIYTTVPLPKYYKTYEEALDYFSILKEYMQEEERKGQEEWLAK